MQIKNNSDPENIRGSFLSAVDSCIAAYGSDVDFTVDCQKFKNDVDTYIEVVIVA